MKMRAFSKLRRSCYCHFPVFLARGGVRPKYQFLTSWRNFKSLTGSGSYKKGGEGNSRLRFSIRAHIARNHNQE